MCENTCIREYKYIKIYFKHIKTILISLSNIGSNMFGTSCCYHTAFGYYYCAVYCIISNMLSNGYNAYFGKYKLNNNYTCNGLVAFA